MGQILFSHMHIHEKIKLMDNRGGKVSYSSLDVVVVVLFFVIMSGDLEA